MALLANTLDSGAAEQLRRALSHKDATVRAVAARVAGIARARGLSVYLKRFLPLETDDAAAAEFARALLYLGDAESIASVEAHLPKARPSTVLAYCEWLVFTRPENLAGRFETVFKSQASHPSWLRPVVSRAIALNPDARRHLLGAWLQAAPPGAWRATLDDLGTEALESVQPVIVEALTSSNPAIRQETVWAVVKKLAGGRHVPEPILDAALPGKDESSADAAPTWEAFGRELLARQYRLARTPSRAVFIAREASSHRSDARMVAAFKLTQAERGALSETLGATLSENPPDPPEPERRGQPVMRTVAIPWPALLPDLLRITGCPVADTLRAGAFEIDYRPDGRPLTVGVIPYDLPPTCKPALEALARMTLADVGHDIVEGDKQLVVVLVSNEQLACLPDALEPHAEGERIGPGRIKQPTKIRDVRPAYPETLVLSRVQGVVVAEAIISRTGCPGSIKVMKSVHALLDFEAVKAVSRWRFTPTLLNGVPVPVVMTVTVNYTLK